MEEVRKRYRLREDQPTKSIPVRLKWEKVEKGLPDLFYIN